MSLNIFVFQGIQLHSVSVCLSVILKIAHPRTSKKLPYIYSPIKDETEEVEGVMNHLNFFINYL